MATPNLALVHIAAAQNQKEVTANAAFDGLDTALTGSVYEAMPDANFTLPTADALGNMVFSFTGLLSASRVVQLPGSKKLYIVRNLTTASGGSFPLVFVANAPGSPNGRTATVYPDIVSEASGYTMLYCDGFNVDVLPDLDSLTEAWQNYTPVVTAQAGGFVSVSATGRYFRIGKTVTFTVTITVTTIGTAATGTLVTLPFAAGSVAAFTVAGVETTAGAFYMGRIAASATQMVVRNTANAIGLGSGQTLTLSGTYETA
jgi:hypothetical protein